MVCRVGGVVVVVAFDDDIVRQRVAEVDDFPVFSSFSSNFFGLVRVVVQASML